MTDQEQIDEMASDMDYACTKRDLYPDDAKEIAKALILLGYRKLLKDSVVISKEEYEDYKKHVDTCVEEYHRGQHEAELYYKNIQIPRERKEIAKKILFKFESAFAYYDNEDMFSKKAVFECLEEIVKSIGIEIKE